MRMIDIIEKKRDGHTLTTEEINFFIGGYVKGDIPDYQASSLAMAIYFQDMNDDERAALTMAMVNSGDMIDLSDIKGVKVDKHSTGGVGDTTTLVLAPLVAAVDVPVAKMSGRGLGHTGGTIDKLEAIDTLKGQGPKDLTELVLTLGSQMVVLANKAETLEEARALLIEAINSGAALEKFKTFIKNQGGDETVIDHPERLPQAQYQIEYKAKKSGYVTELVSNDIGVASMMLGAGRLTKEDDIDLAVGIVLNKKIGDKVEEGESLLTIHSNRQDVDDVVKKLDSSITIADHVVSPTLIHKIITE